MAIPLLEPVKQELQCMEVRGKIAKVEETTEWCAGMVVVPNEDGKVRIYVDLTKLNKNVKRRGTHYQQSIKYLHNWLVQKFSVS